MRMTSSLPDQEVISKHLLEFNIKQRQDEKNEEETRLLSSKRLTVSIFIFFGLLYSFMLRGNLSIALVEMTSNKTIVVGNETIIKGPEFTWDSQTKSWILSLFSYGAVFASLGGYLSSTYGGVTVSGAGLMITAILTMLSPLAIWGNMPAFVVGRIAEGMFETFAYTGFCDMWSRWIPKNELPKIVCFCHSGYYAGAAVTFPICGFIAQNYGWPMIFYVSGFIAVVWSLMLFKYVWNDPSRHKKISLGELNYIRRSTRSTGSTKVTYPWKKILTSKPLWALCFSKFAYSWAHFTLAICFPLFIKDVTNQSTAVVGLLSGVPNYINLFVAPLSGLLIDNLQNNRGINSTVLLKSIMVGCFSLGGLLFIIVGSSSFVVSMICFVLIVISVSINFNVIQISVVCISPNHAGLVAGISAHWFSLSSVLSSLAVGFIVTNHTWQEWSLCFGLSGFILILAAIVTAFLGSTDDQKWSSTEDGTTCCKYGQVTTPME